MFTIGPKISLIFSKILVQGYSFSNQYSNYTNKVTKTDFPDQAVLSNPVQYFIAKNSTEKPVWKACIFILLLERLFFSNCTKTNL